jgi:hypothetical protein
VNAFVGVTVFAGRASISDERVRALRGPRVKLRATRSGEKISRRFFFCRFSVRKPNCSCTPRLTCAKPSRTSVPSVVRRSRTVPIYPSTPGSIWASNRTVAKSAKGSSPSSVTCSSTFVPTRATSRTSE